jgi:cysteine-rich repeat protein
MRMESTGRLDTTAGTPYPGYFEYGDNVIDVGESMYAAPDSRILADGAAGARNIIRYRTQQKPPVLLGTISPPPEMSVLGGNGCPECGNGEIDFGESCDDGNTASGDGCRDDCQDEGCIAASPGWPTDALCDDFDGCTIDSCDSVAHQCRNSLSCEEGIACTVDSCNAGSCLHVPDDAACDDENDCTDDMCSPATGCVHASLTGPACEDKDFCTSANTCYGGACTGGSLARLAGATRIDAKMPDGDANDQLRIRGNIRSVDFTTLPTTSGLEIRLFDSSGQPVFDSHVDATRFMDTSNGAGTSFRFSDKEGSLANGVRDVQIALLPLKGIATIRMKMTGTEIPRALGQDLMSVSFLFGSDPATDQCLTARSIPCVARGTRISCHY